jgi:acetyl-CoA C-acetyltransferase
MVADPLKILDCSPISDGAAALVLAPLDSASSYSKKPIEILASEQASGTLALHDRDTLTSIKAAKIAGELAYKKAGLTPKDIDVAEVHDCFTIAEIIATEDLGFFKPGEGGPAALEGKTKIDGEVAVNTSGGLKATGHPVGATGVKQACEVSWQLRGDGEETQVKDVEYALTHNVGGSGATAVVHLYKRGY